MKTIIFDCDSTLTYIEGIDYLAKIAGKEKAVSELTDLAMAGQINFAEVYAKRLEMIKPTIDQIQKVGDAYIDAEFPGAKSLIEQLKNSGHRVVIISGGILQAVKKFADYLGVEEIYAVELFFDESGQYVGFDQNSALTKNGGKAEVLTRLCLPKPTIFIGDGITDLEAKHTVDKFIGMGSIVTRQQVQQECDHFFVGSNLLKLADLLI